MGKGLILIFQDPGKLTQEEFDAWYDNDHGPPRLTIPGIESAVRWKSLTSSVPSSPTNPPLVATYDLFSPTILERSDYKSMRSKQTQREKDSIAKLSSLNRRVYELVNEKSKDDLSPSLKKGGFLIIIDPHPREDFKDEYGIWFEKVYIPAQETIPGWIRTRRFRLLNQTELAGNAEPGQNEKEGVKAGEFIILNEFENEDVFESRQALAVRSDPGLTNAIDRLTHRDKMQRRAFRLLRDFGPNRA